jgi:hypothetical protein
LRRTTTKTAENRSFPRSTNSRRQNITRTRIHVYIRKVAKRWQGQKNACNYSVTNPNATKSDVLYNT